jgi:adenine-specific DNA-methyltransferase
MSKFEDELVKIWNKPKFVKNSNYVITLDRLTKLGDKGMDVIQKLVSHQNMDKQIEEWKELGIIDNDFNKEDIFESNLLEKRLSDKYKFLPVDTKYFKDLEPEILSLFDDLDNSLDGWLIKSENYQALNTILPKFKDKVKTVYIDPPYNTGNNRFVYNDKYQHSSWLTMMENRLSLTKELMRDDGVIFVSIDDHEVTQLKMLMNVIFGEENFVGDLIRKTKSMTGDKKTGLNIQHESIVCYARNISNMFLKGEEKDFNEYDNPDNDPNGEWISADPSAKSGGPSLYFEIINPYTGKIDLPPKGRYWAFSKETFIEYVKKGKIKFKTQHKDNERGFIFKRYKNELQSSRNPVNSLEFCDNIYMNQVGTKELRELLNGEYFQNPKPVVLIKKLIYYSTSKTDIILDFFGGSGTTVHAVMKLNSEDNGKRKFILIEMGDYFNTVIIPRIKKVSYSFNWKNGRPQDTSGIGVFFKYYELEQFEDVLSNTMYINDETVLKSLETGYDDGKVKVKLNMLYPDVDVVETLSNLTGKWIKKIKGDVVEFEDGSKVNIKELDYKLIKPLIW